MQTAPHSLFATLCLSTLERTKLRVHISWQIKKSTWHPHAGDVCHLPTLCTTYCHTAYSGASLNHKVWRHHPFSPQNTQLQGDGVLH